MRSARNSLILPVLAIVACLGATDAHGAWTEDGVALSRQRGVTGQAAVVQDGSSGAIYAYQACYEGVGYLIAQRVDAQGDPLWDQDGVVLWTAADSPQDLAIAADGAGGAIVVWATQGGKDSDIYAQRVDASGVVQWSSGGVALCTALLDQRTPRVVGDGSGGAIVAWADRRGGRDIFAQRVSAAGVVQWDTDGIVLCANAEAQDDPHIVSDGVGGAFVVWTDERVGATDTDIYGQRVDASGALQWPIDGIGVCTAAGSQGAAQITTDGVGGAFVVWADNRMDGDTTDIYAQRLNASGLPQWPTDGIGICTAAGNQGGARIITDGAGGAILVWMDARSLVWNIYGQRVDAAGTPQWTANGAPLTPEPESQESLRVFPDGSGGAVVAWLQWRSGDHDVYASRVSNAGDIEWAVPLCTAVADRMALAVASDGTGGVIAKWTDLRDEAADIYGQRVDGSGVTRWTENGNRIATGILGQDNPALASDGAGGAIVIWNDDRLNTSNVRAQRADDSAILRWTVDGVPVSPGSQRQASAHLVPDGSGGAIVAWHDNRDGPPDIYAQRLDASGQPQWSAQGVALCTATSSQSFSDLISDGVGGAIVAWQDDREGGLDRDIYAQRVDATGAVSWSENGVAICTAVGDSQSPRMVSDGAGGAIIAWLDHREEDWDVYAQRIDASGIVEWAQDGIPLCKAAGRQQFVELISDGTGGAIAVWEDDRSGDLDIYAQRVDASGVVQWTPDGVVVRTAPGYQLAPVIVSDGAEGAIIAWRDLYPTRDDIYAQRLDASGVALWGADGVSICAAQGERFGPRLVSDDAGGAIVAWVDSRDPEGNDLYAQRLDGSGILQWDSEGVPLSTARAEVWAYAMTPDGVGGAIVAWSDRRCTSWIYSQRVRASGSIVATLLQRHSAEVSGTSILVSWDLAEKDESSRFSVLRAMGPDWRYVELSHAEIHNENPTFSFTDADTRPGSTYRYRVDWQADGIARQVLFETETLSIPVPTVTLSPNYPNPFNPGTTVRFYLPTAQEVSLGIYNVAGELVVNLVDGEQEEGYHEVVWNGCDGSGQLCSSGLYICRLAAGKSSFSRKMVILR